MNINDLLICPIISPLDRNRLNWRHSIPGMLPEYEVQCLSHSRLFKWIWSALKREIQSQVAPAITRFHLNNLPFTTQNHSIYFLCLPSLAIFLNFNACSRPFYLHNLFGQDFLALALSILSRPDLVMPSAPTQDLPQIGQPPFLLVFCENFPGNFKSRS